MSELTQLITKYESTLRIEDWKKVPYKKMRDFEAELIKTKNFRYGIKDMKDMHAFLSSKKFSLYSRYNMMEMILRRKMMDNINDIDKRKGLWLAIDYAIDLEHKFDMIRLYAAKYGTEETEKDLNKMLDSYHKAIEPPLEKIRSHVNGKKSLEWRKYMDEIQENHRQITNCVVIFAIPGLLQEIRETRKSREAQL